MTSIRQASFANGEVAPEIYGATNDPRYSTSLRTCKNFLPIQHGAVVNRPGTKLDAAAKTATPPFLRAFVFTNFQSIILEFGNLYLRFHAAGGPIEVAGVPVEIVTPWAIADVPQLTFSQSGDVLRVTHHSYQTRDLNRLSNVSWTITNTSFGPPAGFVVTGLSPVPNGYGGDTATAWSNATNYSTGQYAFDAAAATPAAYIALAPNTNKQPSANAAWWALAVDGTHIPRVWDYVVTIKYRDGLGRNIEGLPSAKLGGPNVLRAIDRPISCQWTDPVASPGFPFKITGKGVYAGRNGLFGWVGDADAAATSFKDDGTTDPDFSIQPPKATNPFAVADGINTSTTFSWPAASIVHEGRDVYLGSDARPEDFDGSAQGDFTRFDINDPVQDTDTYRFRVSSLKLQQLRHAAGIRQLVLLSAQGEFSAGGAPGVGITPRSIQVRQHSDHGSSFLAPIVIGNLLLFVTVEGNYVRDFVYDFGSDSYVGSDLTTYARHLLDGHTIVDWTYASKRYPIVWMVRDDGLLLSLTYDAKTQTLAWAQHPTAGKVNSVCAIREGNEDFVYLVVTRATGVFIERMQSRLVTDVRTCCFLDSALTFDGRNTFSTTMTVTGASFNAGDIVSMVASSAAFAAGAGPDVGDRVVMNPDGIPAVFDDNGKLITPAIPPTAITLTAVADNRHATGRLETPLDATFQAVATLKWGSAFTRISGFDHLNGQQVTALADGVVQGPFAVAGGFFTLAVPAVIVTAGLPYNSDAELMDVAAERTSVKNVSMITWEVVGSRGLYTGQDFAHLRPVKLRQVSDNFGPPALLTQQVTTAIEGSNNVSGRAVIRQRDPLPLTISAVVREVEFAGKGVS